jgi:hypothetical protein
MPIRERIVHTDLYMAMGASMSDPLVATVSLVNSSAGETQTLGKS